MEGSLRHLDHRRRERRLVQDHVRRFFGDHDHRGIGVAADDGRHHRGVDHPQTLEPPHRAGLVEHGAGPVAHGAARGRMHGGPNVLADVGVDLLVSPRPGRRQHRPLH